jgi:hypothetical protein
MTDEVKKQDRIREVFYLSEWCRGFRVILNAYPYIMIVDHTGEEEDQMSIHDMTIISYASASSHLVTIKAENLPQVAINSFVKSLVKIKGQIFETTYEMILDHLGATEKEVMIAQLELNLDELRKEVEAQEAKIARLR